VVLWGKDFGDLLATVKKADWQYVNLFTIVDGYDLPKMKEGTSWCWWEASGAQKWAGAVSADGGRF
jgi:hypothetical protein